MLLAIDAGNTDIKFAVFDGKKSKAIWRIKTDGARTSDEYIVFLAKLFELAKLKFSDIDDCIVSSVVPDANFQLRLMCHSIFKKKPIFIGKEIKKFDLKILLDKPEEIGADRIANAISAITYYQAPAIVVGFGTATTFDVVDKDGCYRGGAIAPGVNLSLNALHMNAAKLPKVSISRPESAIGTNTVGAMQSGIYWGYVSLATGMIERLKAEMKGKPIVIATGGLAPLFKGDIPSVDKTDEDLTLKGLLSIYLRHKQK